MQSLEILVNVLLLLPCRRKYLGEEFVWRVMYQLLLAMGECHKKREDEEGGKVMLSAYQLHTL